MVKNRETPGATISGKCIDANCSETGWAEFGYFLCYFKMATPIVSFFDHWSRGMKNLGTRLCQTIFTMLHEAPDCCSDFSIYTHDLIIYYQCKVIMPLLYFLTAVFSIAYRGGKLICLDPVL